MPRTKASPKPRPRRSGSRTGRPRSWKDSGRDPNCSKAFYRVLLSRDSPYKIRRVPFSDLYGQLRTGTGSRQTERVANELVQAGIIEGPDEIDF